LSPVTVRKLFAQQPLDSRLRTLVPLLDLLKTERSRHAPQSRLSLDRGPPTHLQADQKSRYQVANPPRYPAPPIAHAYLPIPAPRQPCYRRPLVHIGNQLRRSLQSRGLPPLPQALGR